MRTPILATALLTGCAIPMAMGPPVASLPEGPSHELTAGASINGELGFERGEAVWTSHRRNQNVESHWLLGGGVYRRPDQWGTTTGGLIIGGGQRWSTDTDAPLVASAGLRGGALWAEASGEVQANLSPSVHVFAAARAGTALVVVSTYDFWSWDEFGGVLPWGTGGMGVTITSPHVTVFAALAAQLEGDFPRFPSGAASAGVVFHEPRRPAR